jgi:glycosyltransferase involved in cell wall biosynthesis
MIESLACGTPVIAFECGSVPEVLENGKTGFIVRNLAEAEQGLRRIEKIDRRACRQEFERRYTSARMAEDYLATYARLRTEISIAASTSRHIS